MRIKAAALLGAIALSAAVCWSCGGHSSAEASTQLTEVEKHRLYAAALRATDSPLDSDLFMRVCREIDIYDVANKPNPRYLNFVSEHIRWSMSGENDQFQDEIKTREKALQYVQEHLPVRNAWVVQ